MKFIIFRCLRILIIMHKENQTRQFQTMINAMKTKASSYLSDKKRHFKLDRLLRHH